MRTRALLGVLLASAALAVPSSVTGQSFTNVSVSGAMFDGVGIGLAFRSESPYGIYGGPHGGSRRADYGRYGGGRVVRAYDRYDDYCWEEAWDLRWGRDYYGWDGFGSYDHLDFYHDCLRSGLDYAYDQWRWHSRHAYGFGAPRSGVFVSIHVNDPFWPWRDPYWEPAPYWVVRDDRFRSRGPYFAYDPSSWSGGNFGTRHNLRGWGRSATVVAVGRPSPLALPGFKEDPRGRVAAPATGRSAVPRAGQSGRAPTGGARTADPSTAAAPATGRRGAERPQNAPEGRGDAAVLPSDRRRPSDGVGRGGSSAPAAPATTGRAGSAAVAPQEGAAPDRPSARVRAPATGGAARSVPGSERAPRTQPRATPAAPAERPSTRQRSGASDARESAPSEEAPRARPAPSARSGGGEASAPSARSGGGEASAPRTEPRERGGTAPRTAAPRERGESAPTSAAPRDRGESAPRSAPSSGGERAAPRRSSSR